MLMAEKIRKSIELVIIIFRVKQWIQLGPAIIISKTLEKQQVTWTQESLSFQMVNNN